MLYFAQLYYRLLFERHRILHSPIPKRRSSCSKPYLLCIIRSAIILCVYGLCDSPRLSRGPYLGIMTVCSAVSLLFVSVKASYVFTGSRSGFSGGDVALFVCLLSFAVGHIVVRLGIHGSVSFVQYCEVVFTGPENERSVLGNIVRQMFGKMLQRVGLRLSIQMEYVYAGPS
ncbi:hypothetical protein L2E82_29550 [Cichorium intybus]|uniref:Uncharacterized protein n=1 Tax=Cichorium intybus TaxID=13427 RepID=A0ACB9CY93_CICIN|nr:hypothetical protein L2E82_29550 [Cichorium intybus]